MAIIKYRTNEIPLTKPFSGPIFDAFSPANLDVYSASCAYIINNFMDKLELLDNNALQVDSGSEDDQSEDKDSIVNNESLDPSRIDGIPTGEPSAINDESSNIDKEVSESHHSEVNQEDITLLLSMLDESKEEGTTDRKRDLRVEPEKEVTQSTKDRFCKAEYSRIQPKILKRTELGT